jgi:hypothetical protein
MKLLFFLLELVLSLLISVVLIKKLFWLKHFVVVVVYGFGLLTIQPGLWDLNLISYWVQVMQGIDVGHNSFNACLLL